jgi:hypothetical protein
LPRRVCRMRSFRDYLLSCGRQRHASNRPRVAGNGLGTGMGPGAGAAFHSLPANQRAHHGIL